VSFQNLPFFTLLLLELPLGEESHMAKKEELFYLLDQWRLLVATDLCKNEKAIKEEQLNFIVQKIIEGLLFFRVAESRGIEPNGTLKKIVNKGVFSNNLYTHLLKADLHYNSALFSFPNNKLNPKWVIGNDVLSAVIGQLYELESFTGCATLPIEILSVAYEHFLGNPLKIDSFHIPSIQNRLGFKKAAGVYYTPNYIVEYIVNQTVGEVLNGKSPGEVSKVKIVDPSCGSGNFLLGAYAYLLNWHKDYYTNHNKKVSREVTQLTPEGNLTPVEKKRILITHIYGVDMDENAVGVTKLSLLLKCFEAETPATLTDKKDQLSNGILPTLKSNFKVGNSLLDEDFPGPHGATKPFNWRKEFPSVFAEGGFDVVLGNPPYGAELSRDVQSYYLKKYAVGNTDTAALFMIHAKCLLKEGGYNGYIIPKSFTYASNWQKTRKELLGDIKIIVDCSKVWPKVKLEMSIYISVKNLDSAGFKSCIREGQRIVEIGTISKLLCSDFHFIINGVSDKEVAIGLKMFRSSKRLNDFMTNKRGGMFQKHVSVAGDYRVIAGRQVQKYFIANGINNKVSRHMVPEANAFIKKDSILVQNIVAHIQNPYPRIQISATSVDSSITKTAVILDTVNQLHNFSPLSTNYLLGVLNSKVISWYTYRFVYANAVRTMHFDNNTTARIPFPELNLQDKIHRKQYELVEKAVAQLQVLKKESLSFNPQQGKNIAQEKIILLQVKIDEAVCILFGFTPDEIESLQ
jgi:type I restriction-modification system DNA methylase subunit